MSNFVKKLFALAMIVLSGFLIWKLVNWKHVKTDEDFKKEYRITCERMARITKALDEDYEVVAAIPKAKSIRELREHIERYAPKCSLKDMWGNDFLYYSIDEGNFEIASPGSDGVFDGFDQRGEYSKSQGQDIIAERGGWKFAPENANF